MVLGSIAGKVYPLKNIIFFTFLIVILTCAGFFMAESVTTGHSHEVASIFEAFIVGALLHLITDHKIQTGEAEDRKGSNVLGSLTGLITTIVFCYFHLPF